MFEWFPQVQVFSLAVFYFDISVLDPVVMDRELFLSGRQVMDNNIYNLYSHCVVRSSKRSGTLTLKGKVEGSTGELSEGCNRCW